MTITHAGGVEKLTLDQRKNPGDEPYQTLGTFRFEAGKATEIMISNAGTDGYVIADAVQLILIK
ncbi:MAG: hypothetical protein R3C11_05985 [Planctomycetaceae bacterium]